MKNNPFKTSTKSLLLLISFFWALIGAPFKLISAGRSYSIDFKGTHSILLNRSLKDSSNLVRYRKTRPRSMAALQYRANSDIPAFLDILHAYGYYDACVSDRTYFLPTGKYKIVILVDKGPRYLLNQFDIKLKANGNANSDVLNRLQLRDLDIRLKKPALSTTIVEAQEKLIQKFTENGYPLAKISSEKVLVDQAQKTMGVKLEVDSGPKAYFGKIFLETNSQIRSKFIRNRIPWKLGETYSSEVLKRTEKALYDTGLFSLVSINPGKELTDNNEIPVSIQLIDSKFNGLTVGGSYTTTWEGIGGQASWQTRNIFLSGTDLNLNYQVNQKLQEAGFKYIFPDFLSNNQVLAISSSASKNRQPNYTEQAIKTDLYIERALSNYFKTSIGAKFDQLETSDSDNNGYFSLFGTPLHFNTQSSENVLINPTQGGWANISFIPYFSINEKNRNFTELKFEASGYQFLIPSRRIILAMGMVYGSLFGQSQFEIPTPYRFFAGSPNHLRGYPYQEVSPLDSNNKPIGGRSIFLWSIEPRFMIFKSIAIVGFYDVGNVYSNSWPKLSKGFVKSIGAGVRYFSFVGPLRLDIGFPMNKLPNIKKKYQFYFSFGQAF